MYRCLRCKYESRRYYNVRRHEGRIHGIAKKQRKCCGTIFVTKGEFYEHCEMVHPDLRKWASISKKKYKMVGNSCLDIKLNLPPMDVYCPSTSECKTETTNTRRMSERIKKKTIAALYDKIKPIGALDLEDVPLVNFLNMHSRISYLKNIYSSGVIKMESETSTLLGTDFENDKDFDAGQEAKIENDCVGTQNEERIEQMLPLKKYILTKFFNSGFDSAKCEGGRGILKNCNAIDKVFKDDEARERRLLKFNFKRRIKEPRKRGKYSNLISHKSNAENIPFGNDNDGGFALRGREVKRSENIFLKIDDNVNWSLATKIHRDFLGSIDFDRF